MGKRKRGHVPRTPANLFDPPSKPPPKLPLAVVAEFLPPLAQLFLHAARPEPSAKEVNSHE